MFQQRKPIYTAFGCFCGIYQIRAYLNCTYKPASLYPPYMYRLHRVQDDISYTVFPYVTSARRFVSYLTLIFIIEAIRRVPSRL